MLGMVVSFFASSSPWFGCFVSCLSWVGRCMHPLSYLIPICGVRQSRDGSGVLSVEKELFWINTTFRILLAFKRLRY